MGLLAQEIKAVLAGATDLLDGPYNFAPAEWKGKVRRWHRRRDKVLERCTNAVENAEAWALLVEFDEEHAMAEPESFDVRGRRRRFGSVEISAEFATRVEKLLKGGS